MALRKKPAGAGGEPVLAAAGGSGTTGGGAARRPGGTGAAGSRAGARGGAQKAGDPKAGGPTGGAPKGGSPKGGGKARRAGRSDQAGQSGPSDPPAKAGRNARAATPPPPAGGGGGGEPGGARARLAQIRLVYKITKQRDPRVLWLSLLGLAGPIAVGVILGVFVGPLYVWLPIAVLLGLVVALNVFSRRVQKTAYAEMEGKPGAAAGVVERMRGDWRLTPAVGVNRHQDVVHRVVCRAGVILIAEGRGRGPRELLVAEKRRIRKIVGEAPLLDYVVGNGEGEIPLPKLQSTLMRLRRELRKRDVDALDRRLKAVSAPALPIPKGPIPRNIPRGGRLR
ncbi:DUF4191 domain-containing protein [Frankia sp. Mgl5]|uniref:DUF4191 domain-containing protein n=1 Tax=Frankia sp. Mgl5 TaxID=2933793 RepID=UPI00200EED61|nr:DUF4191 domain-containing protein [Frankia sp. Mgl5]MCK9932569.1 DUF4191 domain-containing protein [Frankia sp. Mgl5]